MAPTTKKFILILLVGLWMAPEKTLASGHEIYWQTGFNFLSGPDRMAAGVGAGPGYRFHINDNLSLEGEVRWTTLYGNSYWLSAGGSFQVAGEFYRPSFGLQLLTLFGDQIRRFSSKEPEPTHYPPLGLLASIAPLRFGGGDFQVNILEIRVGIATAREKPALVFSTTLLEVGLCFDSWGR